MDHIMLSKASRRTDAHANCVDEHLEVSFLLIDVFSCRVLL